jgi:N-acetylglucosamine kinase-like BadF-type ATPase
MFIIAESGATKTDWRSVADDGSVVSVQTEGLNPMMMSQEQLSSIIGKAIPSLNPEGRQVSHVYFYGAGLVSSQTVAVLEAIIDMWCPFSQVEFHTDMEAAARAVFGDGSGVVAIMGTGSNSCLWENGSIARNIRPGGFILGDEGGGAALGRMFLSDYIKGLVPEGLASLFDREFGLDYPAIVKGVYKSEAPSRFVASFARFVCDNRNDGYAAGLIERNIRDFIERSLVRYGNRHVGIVGSLACACRDELEAIGQEYGLEFVKFVKSPIDALVSYHQSK